MTETRTRFVELSTAGRTLRIGFPPPDPDGKPANMLVVRDGEDKLLATFTPEDVRIAALDVIAMKSEDPVPAKRARLLACFALAFLRLRPELLPDGISPSAGSEAGAAPSHAAAPAGGACQVRR